MATFSATDLTSKPRHMGQQGNCQIATGSVTPTAGASADVYRPCIIPAGSEVSAIILANADLDSNGTPTIAFSMGYRPVNTNDGSLSASTTYFAAAGDTTLNAANGGKLYANFVPIKFEQDVFLELTLTAAAATFASGAVRAVVIGENKGVK